MRRRALGKKKFVPVVSDWQYAKITSTSTWTAPANLYDSSWGGSVDAFVVGASAVGQQGSYSTSGGWYYSAGGNGGNGGACNNYYNLPILASAAVPVYITYSQSYILSTSYMSAGGAGSAGAVAPVLRVNASSDTGNYTQNSVPPVDGQLAFGDTAYDGVRYGAGGGYGAAHAYNGGSATGGGLWQSDGGTGATTGGGNGGRPPGYWGDGWQSYWDGNKGTTYGAGGGGGGTVYEPTLSTNYIGTGGAGAPGLVVIRYKLITNLT
jgi:hypothetical protein